MTNMQWHKTDYNELRNTKIGSSGKSDVWIKLRPTETGGDKRYILRLLPAQGNNTSVLYDADIHYFKTPQGYKVTECPGQSCPACEIYWKNRSKPMSDAEKQALSKIQAKTKVYSNVLLRGVKVGKDTEEIDESMQEPQIWAATYRVGNMLRDELLNSAEEGVFLDDLDDGRDIVVKVISRGSYFMVDSISVKPNPSPVGNKDTLVTHDLKEFVGQNRLNPDEIRELLPDVLGEYYNDFVEVPF